MKRILAASATTAIALTGSTLVATPAHAAPLVTGGLVNVTVTDVLNNVTVTVQDINVGLGAALALAANVCDVNVNVLARQLRDGGATCENALTDQAVVIDQV